MHPPYLIKFAFTFDNRSCLLLWNTWKPADHNELSAAQLNMVALSEPVLFISWDPKKVYENIVDSVGWLH